MNYFFRLICQGEKREKGKNLNEPLDIKPTMPKWEKGKKVNNNINININNNNNINNNIKNDNFEEEELEKPRYVFIKEVKPQWLYY